MSVFKKKYRVWKENSRFVNIFLEDRWISILQSKYSSLPIDKVGLKVYVNISLENHDVKRKEAKYCE